LGLAASGWLAVYGILAALIAAGVHRACPGWRTLTIVFWSAAFLPLLGILFGYGCLFLLIRADQLHGRQGPEGNLMGMAFALVIGNFSILSAVIGSTAAWLIVKVRRLALAKNGETDAR
jgi:hypothetical protein